MGIIARGMKKGLIKFVGLYKKYISPTMHNKCIFTPTCSTYAIQAIEEHGSIKGLWLTAKRLLRCHPFSKGGHDPVKTPKGANK